MPHVISAQGFAEAANTVTASINASGSDLYALIGVYQGTDHTISSVTYGSTPAALLSSVGRLSVYGLKNPPTGAQTVTAVSGSSSGFLIGVSVYSEIDTTGTPVTASNNEETSISVQPIGVSGGLCVDFAALVSLSMDEGAGQTERVYIPEATHGAGYFSLGSSEKSGVGTQTMTWESDFTVGTNYQIGIPLIPAESPAGVSGDMDADETGDDLFSAMGAAGSNGVRLTLRDTDTGALAANLTGMIVSIRGASDSSAVLEQDNNASTDADGVLELASGAIGDVGDYVYVTVEKSDNTIVATYRVQVVDLNASTLS